MSSLAASGLSLGRISVLGCSLLLSRLCVLTAAGSADAPSSEPCSDNSSEPDGKDCGSNPRAIVSESSSSSFFGEGSRFQQIFGDIEDVENGTCGVSAILNDEGHVIKSRSLEPKCDRRHMTNCSIGYEGIKCPEKCAYLVPNRYFLCAFSCASAAHCSDKNPDRAYPDPATGICSPCSQKGCKLCSSADRCAVCHDKFTLQADQGTCVFDLDAQMHLNEVIAVIGVLLVFIILFSVCFTCVKGGEAHKAENLKTILRSRRHRHLCKVADWGLHLKDSVRNFYPLNTDFQTKHVLGVGLPLFYNTVRFLCLISLVTFGITSTVFHGSHVSTALASVDHSKHVLDSAVSMPLAVPAMLLSPLSSCSHTSARDIISQVRVFAGHNFYAVGLLYILVFMLSLRHGKNQLAAAYDYDKCTKTMSDFALRVSGLDRNRVDEPELWLQMQEAVDATFKEQKLGDFSAPPQVHGLSICYDYSAVDDKVNDMMYNYIVRMELGMQHQAQRISSHAAGKDSSVRIPQEDTSVFAAKELLQRQVDEDRQQAKEWFSPYSDKRLKSCGEAFIVFKTIKGRSRVWNLRDRLCRELEGRGLIDKSEKEVKLWQVFSEPPSVNWQNIPVTASERSRRLKWAMLQIFLTIAALQFLIVLPFYRWIVYPYSATGSEAGGTKMQLMGMILGLANQLVGIRIYFLCQSLSFPRKDGMDVMILWSNTLLVLVNTFINVGNMTLMVFSRAGGDYGLEIFLSIDSLVALGTEMELAGTLYSLLMPGFFFVGHLMCLLMAGVVPFVWQQLLMKIIFVWRCLPDCLLNILKQFLPWANNLPLGVYPRRNAEKGLEPMEVNISADYNNVIVLPTLCFCMLFFTSGQVHHTFFMMVASSCFFFCFCRYFHLRFCKASYCTTNNVDTVVIFLWGIPLSVIAAACCVWGLRSGHIAAGASVPVKAVLVGAAYFSSLLLWIASYWFLLRPWNALDAEEDDGTIEAVEQDLLYTWFNCNPMYLLKCEYWFHDDCVAADPMVHKDSCLRLSVHGIQGLPNMGLPSTNGARHEVRCECHIANKIGVKRTTWSQQVRDNAVVWDFTCEMDNYADGDSLVLTVLDDSSLLHQRLIGEAVVSAEEIRAGFGGGVNLKAKGRTCQSRLQIKVTPPRAPKALTKVKVLGAQSLAGSKGSSDAQAFVLVEVGGRPSLTFQTPPVARKSDLKWDFAGSIPFHPFDVLTFSVLEYDALTVTSDDLIGRASIGGDTIRHGFDGELKLECANGEPGGSLKVCIEPPSVWNVALTHLRGHPKACGEDPSQTAFFEVGKEYLFLRPEKQALVDKDLRDFLEFETYLEILLAWAGKLTSPVCQRCFGRGREVMADGGKYSEMESAQLLLD